MGRQVLREVLVDAVLEMVMVVVVAQMIQVMVVQVSGKVVVMMLVALCAKVDRQVKSSGHLEASSGCSLETTMLATYLILDGLDG